MSGILKIIDLNAVWEGNLEAISHFFCGWGHVIPKLTSPTCLTLTPMSVAMLSMWLSSVVVNLPDGNGMSTKHLFSTNSLKENMHNMCEKESCMVVGDYVYFQKVSMINKSMINKTWLIKTCLKADISIVNSNVCGECNTVDTIKHYLSN